MTTTSHRSPQLETVPEVHGCRKRLQLCDGVDAKEALAAAEVVVPYGGVVLLSRRVQDVDLDLLSIQHHLLPVTVSFGRLVVLHKLQRGGGGETRDQRQERRLNRPRCEVSHLVIHELQREGRLPHSPTAHHDHLVQSQRVLAFGLRGCHGSADRET